MNDPKDLGIYTNLYSQCSYMSVKCRMLLAYKVTIHPFIPSWGVDFVSGQDRPSLTHRVNHFGRLWQCKQARPCFPNQRVFPRTCQVGTRSSER